MKQWFFILMLSSAVISCSSLNQRQFFISEAENAAAWSRAHVAMFKMADYEFSTVNEYIILSRHNDYYVTRERINNQYRYTVGYVENKLMESFPSEAYIAQCLENAIKNIKNPETEKEPNKK